MQFSLEALFEAALRLPENERIALAGRLLKTISASNSTISLDDDSLLEELERRFADCEEGIDWLELQAESYDRRGH